MKTLYVSDLDGTMLGKKAEMTKHTADIINRLVSHGMLFTFATARSLDSAAPIVSGLYLRLPVIVFNGAFIVDTKKGMPVDAPCFFGAEQKTAAFEALRQAGIFPLVYTLFEGRHRIMWVEGRETGGMLGYLNSHRGDPRMCPCKCFEELGRGDVYYFTAIGVQGGFERVLPHFSKKDEFNINLQKNNYNDFEFLEIMRADANKGRAVLKLKAMLGAEKVVSFGDNINDLSMFSASDESYAVAGAPEEIKAAASGVIGAAENDGVAVWLKENWL